MAGSNYQEVNGGCQHDECFKKYLGDNTDSVQEDQISSSLNNVNSSLDKENHCGRDDAVLAMQDKLEVMEAELQEQRALISDLRKETQEPGRESRWEPMIESSFFKRSSRVYHHIPGKSRLPNDIYSFYVCSEAFSRAFFFALFVFGVQIAIYALIASNQINIGSDDNPLGYPANVDANVRVSQFICIIIAVLTQEDLREALGQASEGYNSESIEDAFSHASRWKFSVSCALRFLEGALGLLVTLFLIIRSNDVIELLLNFTAIEFVSQLDNVAFQLAAVGYFGKSLRQTCELILDTSYTVPKKQKSEKWNRSILLLLVFSAMLSGWAVVVHKQRHGHYLCKAIFVQFGDTTSAELGAYTGVYKLEQDSRRNDQRVRYVKHHTFIKKSGSFGYCIKEAAWTYFLEDEDVCDGMLARSSETNSFDILETESSRWDAVVPFSAYAIEIEQFQMTCVESDDTETRRCDHDVCMNDCVDDVCLNGCNENSFGVYCTDIASTSDYNSIEPPCRTLEAKSVVDGLLARIEDITDDFVAEDSIESEKFKIFEDKNESFQVYYNPVYVPTGNVPLFMESSFIFFGGRRWYFVLESAFGNKNASQVKASIESAFSNSVYITFVSDAVDIVSLLEIKTPLGLQWFYPDIDEVTDKITLPLPDNSRPVAGYLVCDYCDDETNPCLYEGVCNASDGTCDCVHNTGGSLCINIPLGDEHCDPFFNTAEYDYDGGDCCQATCYNSISGCGGGSLEDINSAFGENNLPDGGKAYPHCIDPKMVNISIELYRKGADIEVDVELECERATILHLPFAVLDRKASVINGTQTVPVEDSSDCLLRIGLRDERVEIGLFRVDFKYKVCLGESCENSTTLYESVDDIVYLDGNQKMFQNEFLVSSVWKEISTHSSIELLQDINSPEGKAIRFESKDDYAHQQNIELLQRYALLVLNYATGDWMFRDGLGVINKSECDFPLYVTCKDGIITGLDLSNQHLSGTIPPEISLLTTLEHLSLWGNSIGGVIPPEIGSLTNLKALDIHLNEFTGTIPSEMRGLTSLNELELSYNDLHGSIPATIGELGNLLHLVIENCNLTGTIPPSLGNLTTLEQLDLENNFLTGSIPDLRTLTNLIELDLENNALNGSIPESLSQLTSLMTVVLKDNPNLYGSKPRGLCDKDGLIIYVDCSYSSENNCSNLKYCNITHCGPRQELCSHTSGEYSSSSTTTVFWLESSPTLPPSKDLSVRIKSGG